MGKAKKRFFREYRDHTLLKLGVLRAYLSRWARILLQSGRQRRVWFVDGFAGKGQDDKGNEGSPLIACRIAAAVEADFDAGSREVRVIAVEASRAHATALRNAIDGFGPAQGHSVPIHHGELGDHVDEILLLTENEPTLYFLDPFGVKGLRADLLPLLLRGPMNELLILFSDEGAHRLQGAATSPKPKNKSPLHRGQEDLFSFTAPHPTRDMQPEGEDDDEPDAAVRGWERTAPASEEILDVAFGGNYWKDVMEGIPRHLARRTWLELYMDLLRRSGAAYVTPFSVVDHDDDHVYYLVHAAKGRAAVRAMKDALRSALNAREREDGRRQGMLFDTVTDIARVVSRLERRFAGQGPVRWTDKKGYENTVQGFAICETDAFYADMDALQEMLAARGYLVSARPFTYEFPPMNAGG
jgi:three-Cys-motif partner protein